LTKELSYLLLAHLIRHLLEWVGRGWEVHLLSLLLLWAHGFHLALLLIFVGNDTILQFEALLEFFFNLHPELVEADVNLGLQHILLFLREH